MGKMITKRQEKIIEVLRSCDSYKTGNELATLLNVSDRTIRSDINAIKKCYPDLIESNVRYGYSIDEEVLDEEEIEYDCDIPQNSEERCKYILLHLLKDNTSMNLFTLSSMLYVSSNTLENDISKIRSRLKKYCGLKLVRRNNRISLNGNEMEKRILYKDMLADETDGNFLNLNQIDQLYREVDILKVKSVFERILESEDYKIREEVFPLLMIHIGVALERMQSENYVKKTSIDLSEVSCEHEYAIAKRFYQEMETMMNIETNETEIVLLATLLLGKRSRKTKTSICEGVSIDVEALVDDLIQDINENYSINFSDDEVFRFGLSLHIVNLIDRLEHQMSIENLYVKEIKRTYPLIFEMAVFVGTKIGERIDGVIAEDELGFLALHLGAAYERLKTNHHYHVVLIQPNNHALRNICSTKIKEHFSERMVIDAIVPYFVESQMRTLQPDFIITTVPVRHDLDIPTILISMFLNENDEFKIFKCLNDLDYRRVQRNFEGYLKDLISDDCFECDVEVDTPNEVIEMMCHNLVENDYVDESFIESVLEREKTANTSFAYGFAIPHTLGYEAKRSTISIAMLKHPIQWGTNYVHMVFMLAVNQQDKDLFKIFLDWLSTVTTDATLLSNIATTRNANEFIERVTKA